jgi:hypothetical protein
MSLRVSLSINGVCIDSVEIVNRGPIGGEYAEGDEPGGPGLRSYEWVSTEKSGWVRHRRDDGAHALAAKVLTEIHQPQPEGTTR